MSRTSRAGCVVFSDLVGFTELTADLGDDYALSVLDRQSEIVRMVMPERARIVKELGDGLLMMFDDACEAVATVLRMRAALEHPAGTRGEPLWLRIGAHWGAPARRGDDIVGHDVNLAARIVDLAGPGEVLASEPVVSRLDGAYPVEEVGPVVMRGIPEAVRLFRIGS